MSTELQEVQQKLEVVQVELEVVQGELEELKSDAAIGDLLTRLDETKKEADAELHKSEAALQQSVHLQLLIFGILHRVREVRVQVHL